MSHERTPKWRLMHPCPICGAPVKHKPRSRAYCDRCRDVCRRQAACRKRFVRTWRKKGINMSARSRLIYPPISYLSIAAASVV